MAWLSASVRPVSWRVPVLMSSALRPVWRWVRTAGCSTVSVAGGRVGVRSPG
jgi:hypothetical protein